MSRVKGNTKFLQESRRKALLLLPALCVLAMAGRSIWRSSDSEMRNPRVAAAPSDVTEKMRGKLAETFKPMKRDLHIDIRKSGKNEVEMEISMGLPGRQRLLAGPDEDEFQAIAYLKSDPAETRNWMKDGRHFVVSMPPKGTLTTKPPKTGKAAPGESADKLMTMAMVAGIDTGDADVRYEFPRHMDKQGPGFNPSYVMQITVEPEWPEGMDHNHGARVTLKIYASSYHDMLVVDSSMVMKKEYIWFVPLPIGRYVVQMLDSEGNPIAESPEVTNHITIDNHVWDPAVAAAALPTR